ncbi:hypothetical protein V8C26DRAFT_384582 [Trichoderma gracile]
MRLRWPPSWLLLLGIEHQSIAAICPGRIEREPFRLALAFRALQSYIQPAYCYVLPKRRFPTPSRAPEMQRSLGHWMNTGDILARAKLEHLPRCHRPPTWTSPTRMFTSSDLLTLCNMV